MSRLIYFFIIVLTVFSLAACGLFSREKNKAEEEGVRADQSAASATDRQTEEEKIINDFFDSIIKNNKAALKRITNLSDEHIDILLTLNEPLSYEEFKIKNQKESYEGDLKKIEVSVDFKIAGGLIKDDYVFFIETTDDGVKITEYVKL